jgi:RNA polymerase subunit RPABC4/transcription elongation factor Spt4
MKLAGEQELQCVECGRGSETFGWRGYLTIDNEMVIYCPNCAEREFATEADVSD